MASAEDVSTGGTSRSFPLRASSMAALVVSLGSCYVKQHTLDEIVNAAMLFLGHLFKTLYQINAQSEHCGFLLYCCFHSAIILFAKIKQIYITNKSISKRVADRDY